MKALRPVALVLVVALLACGGGGGDDESSPGEAATPVAEPERQPRPELVESLLEDLATERHPADGGGRAWLDAANSDATATVATPGRWSVVYEAGPAGVAAGGAVYLQVSPFWGWSTPQTESPTAAGYTEVTTAAEGVILEPRTLDQQLLAVTVRGRALAAGERLRIDYGAGPAGAVADRFAEAASRFWIAVDGDGDGVRGLIAESPGVDVLPGPAARLLAFLPSTAAPGQTVELTLAIVDAVGNGGVPFIGEVRLEDLPGVTAPAAVVFTAADGGSRRVEVTAREPGVVRLRAVGPDGLEARSNPMQVAGAAAPIFWGDLQNHSALSDGTAQLEGFFGYARDVAALDVVALTDHDHWGLRFLDQTPAMWSAIRRATERYHDPGRFVTILGYEWTNWIHGHRHVLYFEEAGAEVLSSLAAPTDTPQELWQSLAGRRVLTVAHHSAGGPISTDWSIPPDPELEPVTEIVSVHGASEAADAPVPIYRPVAGNFVRDALDRGYHLGFMGSSDGHDGHPGLGHLASPSGGLAAILAESLTRDAIYEALRARRVYATNGPRIVLRVSWGGWRMGDIVPLRRDGDTWTAPPSPDPVPGIPPSTLVAQVMAESPIDRIDVVHRGRIESLDCAGEIDCSLGAVVDQVVPGDYLYVRVVQEDGGAAWSSPVFFVEGDR